MDGVRKKMKEEKPWGTEEVWASTHRYVGKLLCISAGHRLSRKYHRIRSHTIRVLEGELTLEVGPRKPGDEVEKITLTPGMAYYVQPRLIHRFCAEGEDVRLVEVSDHRAPDSVRLEDDYRRITDIPEMGPQSEK